MIGSLLEFSEDVKGLYFKTGIKDIEDSYISLLAARAEDVSDEEIVAWIREAYTVKLSDPKVSQALKVLPSINADDLMNRWNNWLIENTKFSPQFARPKKDFQYAGEFIGYYIVFSKLIGNPNAGLMLRPFENVLKFFGSPQVKEQIAEAVNHPDSFTVFHDLMQLQETFLKQKEQKDRKDQGTSKDRGRVPKEEYGVETKQDKKQNLYDDLYDWFSDDFSKAAKNMGYDDLSQQMEQGGLLGNVDALKEYLNKAGLGDDIYVSQPNPLYMELLEEIVKFIIKPANLNRYLKPENHLEAYREIKEYIMKMVGYATVAEIAKVRMERGKQRKIPSRSKEAYYGNDAVEGPEINLPDDAWMSGKVMSLISTVLAELYYKFNL